MKEIMSESKTIVLVVLLNEMIDENIYHNNLPPDLVKYACKPVVKQLTTVLQYKYSNRGKETT